MRRERCPLVQATLDQGLALRNAGLDAVELHHASWIEVARAVAIRICQRDGDVDTDRIQKIWTRPSNVHPNAVGAILRAPRFRLVGYKMSERPSAHARRIGVWCIQEVKV
jgi:hypothetical protein